MSRIAAFAFSMFLGFGALVAPASAAQHQTMQTVSYADLDLDDEAGATRMIMRIDHAARSVCGDRSGTMTLAERRAIRACRTESEQRAVTDLNHPVVTAMYFGRAPTIIVANND